jgi:hypothetical protein
MQKRYVAVFSSKQESLISVFPYVRIVPYEEVSTCLFLMMLQHLIAYFAPVVSNKMQVHPLAILSANDEYDKEHVIEVPL